MMASASGRAAVVSRSTLKGRGVAVALSLALLSAGCDPPGKPNSEDRPEFPAQRSGFEGLLKENCIGCHGKDGKMGAAPPLNDPLFRAGISEKEIRDVLTSGRKGTLMPAFLKDNSGALTASQIEVLVHE